MRFNNIYQMSVQDVFDKVSTHLLTQNEKSLLSEDDEDPNDPYLTEPCAYRGEGGLTCAIGCLIIDQDYDDTMEQKPVGSLLMYQDSAFYKPILASQGRGEVIQKGMLLKQLQRIHDEVSVDGWLDSLTKLAVSQHLSTKALEVFRNV